MKMLSVWGRVALLGISAVALLVGFAGVGTSVLAQDLPDVVPMLTPETISGVDTWSVTRRSIGGVTANRLEFAILTANIGGQDFWRPRDPVTQQWLIPQIYEFGLYLLVYDEKAGDYFWAEVDRRRKNTICTIDDSRRGRQSDLACLRSRTTPFFGCGLTQGVSRGWGDDYFRGLAGQWVVVGDYVGWFLLETHLDPDGDLQRTDIPNRSKDATHDNNYAYAMFYWDGSLLWTDPEWFFLFHGYDRTTLCP